MAVELSEARHPASGSDGTTVGGRSGAPVILEAALPPSNRRGLGLGGSGGGSGGRSEHVGVQTMLTCSRAKLSHREHPVWRPCVRRSAKMSFLQTDLWIVVR